MRTDWKPNVSNMLFVCFSYDVFNASAQFVAFPVDVAHGLSVNAVICLVSVPPLSYACLSSVHPLSFVTLSRFDVCPCCASDVICSCAELGECGLQSCYLCCRSVYCIPLSPP